MAATSPAEAGPSTAARAGASPPSTSNSEQFSFTCRCLNVQVKGQIANGEAEQEGETNSGSLQVWLAAGAEFVKHPAYVALEDDEFRPSRRPSRTNQGEQQEAESSSWRKCWICGVRCYQATGKARPDVWVTVDLSSGIRYDAELDAEPAPPALPFSSLYISLPASSSNFGRPPNAIDVSLYPPTSTSTIPDSLIPPVYDPFFLPAPFIPSHPHLRDLCYQAVRYLHDSHTGLEDEVKHYIAMKSTEMRTLEEKVRAEVEILWEKYREGPGRGEERQRSRSTSSRRSNELRQTPSRTPIQSKTFSPPTDVKDNPILAEAASSPIMPGSSLLSASLSANAFYAQAPSPIPDPVDDSIDEMSKRVDTRSDARAVAMSHVFSVLDDAMGVEKPRGRKERMNRQELKGKDSWIDDERRLLARRAMAEDESQGSTPRRRMPIKLPEGNGQTKERAVKFEEPEMSVVEEDGELEEDQVEPENGDIDRDEYVFDFELEVPASPHLSEGTPNTAPEPARTMGRARNIVDASLHTTLAADAPSHRAAWRKIEQTGSIYASLRRGSKDSDDENSFDEAAVSRLAMSMPMDIVLSKRRGQADIPMEPKTSLSDRKGIMVPPLMMAMREKGIPGGLNSLGLDEATPRERPARTVEPRRRGSRSASVSREREGVKTYGADPGAVFETLADEGEDDEDDENGRPGALRDGRKFVPPHVLARNESREPDVGWRSLVSD